MNLFFWYNLSMENLVNNYLNNTSSCNEYYTPIQLRLPLDLETSISFDDPIYTFDEVMKGCNRKIVPVENTASPYCSITNVKKPWMNQGNTKKPI